MSLSGDFVPVMSVWFGETQVGGGASKYVFAMGSGPVMSAACVDDRNNSKIV